ncbi:MAG: SMI1/KNR4 family protein [candidate division Zixibacteria bacterium]|nr:SMI1/KNR4 family protein [candidate division Zixibacteria bacterium]
MLNMDNITDINSLVNSLKNKYCAGGVEDNEIDSIEKAFHLSFPPEYREFLKKYGAIKTGNIKIFGLGVSFNSELSLKRILALIRLSYPDFPGYLVPIERSEDNSLFCLNCDYSLPDKLKYKLVKYSYDKESKIEPLNTDFFTYLYDRLKESENYNSQMIKLRSHVLKFEEDFLKKGKLPRNYVWRPYRFCSQDVVLGLTVVRHSVDNNCLEVDVCMTTDVLEFEEGIGAKVTTAFLLSEAYKCGGSMEIRFSPNVEGHRVPASICSLAEMHGIKLKNISDGRITPSESRLLYLAISEFSQSLRDLIESLFREGRLSIERPCYALYHGLWTRSQIEHIILGSSRPESILGGDTWPEQRHLYINDLKHASAAVMGGVLDRKLAKRDRDTKDEALDLEDDVRPLDISFNLDYYAKIYSCSEEMYVPWVKQQSTQIVKPGNEIDVLVRAYDIEDLTRYLAYDIQLARGLNSTTENHGKIISAYVLVPRDFEELSPELQIKLLADAKESGVGIIVCPETIVALEVDSARRLASSRRTRE